MFESAVHAPEELRTLGDAALVDAITASARTAAAVQAHHLAAIAELARRRLAGAQHPRWACDDWDSAAAEIGCALTIKHGRALSLMERARTLADELPKVGALFLAGRISAPTAMTIVARTTLITDPDARAEVDADVQTGLDTLKADVVAAGVESVTGIKMPIHPKRRFQDGAGDSYRGWKVSKAWCRQVFLRQWEERLKVAWSPFAERVSGNAMPTP